MPPPVPLPLREALLTVREKPPPRLHQTVLTQPFPIVVMVDTERVHKLPAPQAGGIAQEAGSIFICLDDILRKRLKRPTVSWEEGWAPVPQDTHIHTSIPTPTLILWQPSHCIDNSYQVKPFFLEGGGETLIENLQLGLKLRTSG